MQSRPFLTEAAAWLADVPTSGDPMYPVLCLSAFQVCMGLFDVVYHHELLCRLPWTPTAADEQHIHAVRTAVYVAVYGCFAGVTPHGMLAYALAAGLIAEIGVTCWDFVVEDRTRLFYPESERITHTLMAINYGAILGYFLPVLVGEWGALPTGVELTTYGLFTPLYVGCAAGLGLWTVRDELASRRLARFAEQPLPALPLQTKPARRVLIAGGSGFVGMHLSRCLLNEGHAVTVVTRDRAATMRRFQLMRPAPACAGGELTLVGSVAALGDGARFDAVVNLAGAPLVGRKWTPERVAEIFDSRVGATRELVALMARMRTKPEAFVCGSAVGAYGVGLDEVIDGEDSAPLETKSLSYRLCAAWEGEAREAEKLGVRTVMVRTGVVLGRDGGALAQMLPAFEAFAGGPMGSGKQGMSWIHVDDAARAIAFAADNDAVHGAINLTAPAPATGNEFAKSLGAALGRPAVVRIPSPAVRALFGDAGEELLLGGSLVLPKKLLAHGFAFEHPELAGALAHIVDARHSASCENKI